VPIGFLLAVEARGLDRRARHGTTIIDALTH
jgi:hypothetical protein